MFQNPVQGTTLGWVSIHLLQAPLLWLSLRHSLFLMILTFWGVVLRYIVDCLSVWVGWLRQWVLERRPEMKCHLNTTYQGHMISTRSSQMMLTFTTWLRSTIQGPYWEISFLPPQPPAVIIQRHRHHAIYCYFKHHLYEYYSQMPHA